jgi:hypothetical protein
MRKLQRSPLVAALLSAAASAVFGALPDAPGEAAPPPARNSTGGGPRGQASVNHAARAARSHAGKPATYVKGY